MSKSKYDLSDISSAFQKSNMCDYNMLDPDDKIPCPYNKTEQILVRRIQYHLIKCPYKYMSEIEFDTCPYNASHVVPKSEMKNHKACCPGRALVERIINKELSNQTAGSNMNILKGCTDVPSYETYVIPCTEDWDQVSSDEPNVDTDWSSINSNSRYTKRENLQDNSEDPPEYLEFKIKRLAFDEHQTEDKVIKQPNITPAKKSTVYEYSLNMAGVVCGQALPKSHEVVNLSLPSSLQRYSMKSGISKQTSNVQELHPNKPANIEAIDGVGQQKSTLPLEDFDSVCRGSVFETVDEIKPLVTIPLSGFGRGTFFMKQFQDSTAITAMRRMSGRGMRLSPDDADISWVSKLSNFPKSIDPNLTSENVPFIGIGRGSRLQNKNKDPNLFPSVYGISETKDNDMSSNEYFEYAKK